MMTGGQTLVARPHKADGIGQALRKAFRGGVNGTPQDMQKLLDKLL
ncbi:hypothetical protein [Sphingomonas sp. C3-2]|nr:hypothetical protein [Sphingomonas sp. C3-2]WOK35722.1 hypothetical protein QYC26_11950 [Sphingomonas sp. C3-2]